MCAHEETEDWVCRSFKLATAMQAADAQIKAKVLAEATGAAVAATPHPVSGSRAEYDDMLNVLELVASVGLRPSPWEGEELEWTTGIVQGGSHTVHATGDSTGLSVEFPFQSRTSLLTASTREGNPQPGNGVLLVLHLPTSVGEADGLRFAAELSAGSCRP